MSNEYLSDDQIAAFDAAYWDGWRAAEKHYSDRIEALERARSLLDCRYAGKWAEASGSHCPLERPCQRCSLEREIDTGRRSALEEAARVARGYSASDVPAPIDEVSYGLGRAHAAAAIRKLMEKGDE